MAKREIVWTETAARQRREILRYWKERNASPTYSIKLVKIIASHLKTISKNPKAFKEVEFEDVRESALGHFSLYYRYTEKQLIVMAFWDNRQDPKTLLKLMSEK